MGANTSMTDGEFLGYLLEFVSANRHRTISEVAMAYAQSIERGDDPLAVLAAEAGVRILAQCGLLLCTPNASGYRASVTAIGNVVIDYLRRECQLQLHHDCLELLAGQPPAVLTRWQFMGLSPSTRDRAPLLPIQLVRQKPMGGGGAASLNTPDDASNAPLTKAPGRTHRVGTAKPEKPKRRGKGRLSDDMAGVSPELQRNDSLKRLRNYTEGDRIVSDISARARKRIGQVMPWDE
jgi:hypothetical protein